MIHCRDRNVLRCHSKHLLLDVPGNSWCRKTQARQNKSCMFSFCPKQVTCLFTAEAAEMTSSQAGGPAAAGLFDTGSPDSDAFADAVSESQPGSRSSSATASSFQTAPSAQRNNSGDASNSGNEDAEGEDEACRSSQRGRRGAGLAGVLGSPSPPRRSRFARFASSAAAATGLGGGKGSAQQGNSNTAGSTGLKAAESDKPEEDKSEEIQPASGKPHITCNVISAAIAVSDFGLTLVELDSVVTCSL